MKGNASHRLVLLPGGGQGAGAGGPPRRTVSLTVIDGQAGRQPDPAPAPAAPAAEERIAAARRFRRELEARIARPLEDLL